MKSDEKQEQRKAFDATLAKIMKRATTDEIFRQLCISNPAAAYKAEAGTDLDPAFKLRFVDNQHAHMTIVLPDVSRGSTELADAELDQVAGGTFFQDLVHGCQQTCRASAGSNFAPLLCGPDVVH